MLDLSYWVDEIRKLTLGFYIGVSQEAIHINYLRRLLGTNYTFNAGQIGLQWLPWPASRIKIWYPSAVQLFVIVPECPETLKRSEPTIPRVAGAITSSFVRYLTLIPYQFPKLAIGGQPLWQTDSPADRPKIVSFGGRGYIAHGANSYHHIY